MWRLKCLVYHDRCLDWAFLKLASAPSSLFTDRSKAVLLFRFIILFCFNRFLVRVFSTFGLFFILIYQNKEKPLQYQGRLGLTALMFNLKILFWGYLNLRDRHLSGERAVDLDLNAPIVYGAVSWCICSFPISHLSHVMRKPVFAICEQQRRKLACTSAQSGQRLWYSLFR